MRARPKNAGLRDSDRVASLGCLWFLIRCHLNCGADGHQAPLLFLQLTPAPKIAKNRGRGCCCVVTVRCEDRDGCKMQCRVFRQGNGQMLAS